MKPSPDSPQDDLDRWIQDKRATRPARDLGEDIMARLEGEIASPSRPILPSYWWHRALSRGWARAAVFVLAGIAGLVRIALVLAALLWS